MLFGTLKYDIVHLVFFMYIYLDIDGLHYIYTMYYICWVFHADFEAVFRLLFWMTVDKINK